MKRFLLVLLVSIMGITASGQTKLLPGMGFMLVNDIMLYHNDTADGLSRAMISLYTLNASYNYNFHEINADNSFSLSVDPKFGIGSGFDDFALHLSTSIMLKYNYGIASTYDSYSSHGLSTGFGFTPHWDFMNSNLSLRGQPTVFVSLRRLNRQGHITE